MSWKLFKKNAFIIEVNFLRNICTRALLSPGWLDSLTWSLRLNITWPTILEILSGQSESVRKFEIFQSGGGGAGGGTNSASSHWLGFKNILCLFLSFHYASTLVRYLRWALILIIPLIIKLWIQYWYWRRKLWLAI